MLYSSADEEVSVNALVKDETIWLTQKAMAELFGCSTDNISLHLKNIFADGELEKNSVTEKISATATDGKKYNTQFYNLDAIISVGYRVNSRRATQFRIWQQITDIFVECSIDYELKKSCRKNPMTQINLVFSANNVAVNNGSLKIL